MKNINIIKSRFMKDTLNVKLGGIAANLARVSSFIENIANKKAVLSILEESKYFIEWVTPEAPFRIQVLLAEIQPTLALWQYVLMKKEGLAKEKEKIKKKAEAWSRHLLKISGLLK